MKKLQSAIELVTITVASVMFAAVTVLLTYNVFARFLGGGVRWYMEASQYLNVWSMLIAGIAICGNGEHLRINALETMMKGKLLKANRLLISLLTIVFYLIFAYGTFLLASKSKQVISTMAPLKMSYVYWLMPAIAVLSAIAAALHAVIQFKEDEEGGDGK